MRLVQNEAKKGAVRDNPRSNPCMYAHKDHVNAIVAH